MSARVLVTGANGFVGTALIAALARSGYIVRAALRADRDVAAPVAEKCVVGDIGATTDWSAALECVDYVIHLAARVHVLHDSPANENLYLEANALGTQRLASAAARAGVRRFIYISSIKVNGEETAERAFSSADPPQPLDAYGVSKWRAEQYLSEVAHDGLEYAVVRPPLVYGPGVRANFLRLLRWVDKGLPLPLGAVANRRSLVSVWNLCDLLQRLLASTVPSGRVWLVSDGEDLSTPALIRRIARAMNKSIMLPPVPVSLLVAGGKLLGKAEEVRRLCGSMAVDIAATRRDLNWVPPVSVDESLARTVDWYLRSGSNRGV
jgi:nucleoside-diphosphate-sugar epimerase